MKPAKDWYGSDGIRLSAAIVRIGNRVHDGTDGRIRDTGTQGHMWARRIVNGESTISESTVNAIPIVESANPGTRDELCRLVHRSHWPSDCAAVISTP
jgi:hypothetical protein